MLPIVDTNWNPSLQGEGCDVHTLRAISVQPIMTHADVLSDLESLCLRAQTPGLGGLPHGVVAYVDLTAPQALSHIDELAGQNKVRGLHLVMAEQGLEESTLASCLERMAEHQLLIDISGDVAAIKSCIKVIAKHQQIPLVLNVSQCSRAGNAIPMGEWPSVVQELAGTDNSEIDSNNIAIKLSDIADERTEDNENIVNNSELLLTVVKQIVEIVGQRRLILGSASNSRPADKGQSVWSRFDGATAWASAGERDQWFRSNAVRIYRV